MAKRVIKQVEGHGFEKIGDSYTGNYVGRKTVSITDKKGTRDAPLFTLEGEDGNLFGVWGSAMLDDLMAQVEKGERIRITLKDITTPKAKGMNGMNVFEVEVLD